MHINLTGKGITLGENMQQYATERLGEVVEKYFSDAVEASVVFYHEGDLIKADISAHPQSGLMLRSDAKSGDAYAAFDEAVAKLARQMGKYKQRIIEHKAQPIQEITAKILADDVLDDESDSPAIIAEINTIIPECSVSEAVMRMNLASLPAMMFRHGDKIGMVYHRPDGNIGWIETNKG